MSPSRRNQHIHIESAVLSLDFQGTIEQVVSVAAELGYNADLLIIVDDEVAANLPALPCARLWE